LEWEWEWEGVREWNGNLKWRLGLAKAFKWKVEVEGGMAKNGKNSAMCCIGRKTNSNAF
jgi:hypothetical protein